MSNSTKKNERPYLLKGQGIPKYDAITPSEIEKHIPTLLKELDEKFYAIEKHLEQKLNRNESLGWDEVMKPLHELGEKLRWSWGVICHLNGVCNTSELREAHAAQQPEIVRFSNRIGQSKIIHKALCSLKRYSLQKLDKTQKRVLETELLSMSQRGVGLDKDNQNFAERIRCRCA